MGVGGYIGREEEPEEFVGGGGFLLKPFVYQNGRYWEVNVMYSTVCYDTWKSATQAAIQSAQEKRISIRRRRRA